MEKGANQMTLDKQSYTFPAQPLTTDLCYSCDEFDESRCRELTNCVGYCNVRKIPLYRTDFAVCIDFKGVIPDITKELKD
jgi:hypothetical protein